MCSVFAQFQPFITSVWDWPYSYLFRIEKRSFGLRVERPSFFVEVFRKIDNWLRSRIC